MVDVQKYKSTISAIEAHIDALEKKPGLMSTAYTVTNEQAHTIGSLSNTIMSTIVDTQFPGRLTKLARVCDMLRNMVFICSAAMDSRSYANKRLLELWRSVGMDRLFNIQSAKNPTTYSIKAGDPMCVLYGTPPVEVKRTTSLSDLSELLNDDTSASVKNRMVSALDLIAPIIQKLEPSPDAPDGPSPLAATIYSHSALSLTGASDMTDEPVTHAESIRSSVFEALDIDLDPLEFHMARFEKLARAICVLLAIDKLALPVTTNYIAALMDQIDDASKTGITNLPIAPDYFNTDRDQISLPVVAAILDHAQVFYTRNSLRFDLTVHEIFKSFFKSPDGVSLKKDSPFWVDSTKAPLIPRLAIQVPEGPNSAEILNVLNNYVLEANFYRHREVAFIEGTITVLRQLYHTLRSPSRKDLQLEQSSGLTKLMRELFPLSIQDISDTDHDPSAGVPLAFDLQTVPNATVDRFISSDSCNSGLVRLKFVALNLQTLSHRSLFYYPLTDYELSKIPCVDLDAAARAVVNLAPKYISWYHNLTYNHEKMLAGAPAQSNPLITARNAWCKALQKEAPGLGVFCRLVPFGIITRRDQLDCKPIAHLVVVQTDKITTYDIAASNPWLDLVGEIMVIQAHISSFQLPSDRLSNRTPMEHDTIVWVERVTDVRQQLHKAIAPPTPAPVVPDLTQANLSELAKAIGAPVVDPEPASVPERRPVVVELPPPAKKSQPKPKPKPAEDAMEVDSAAPAPSEPVQPTVVEAAVKPKSPKKPKSDPLVPLEEVAAKAFGGVNLPVFVSDNTVAVAPANMPATCAALTISAGTLGPVSAPAKKGAAKSTKSTPKTPVSEPAPPRPAAKTTGGKSSKKLAEDKMEVEKTSEAPAKAEEPEHAFVDETPKASKTGKAPASRKRSRSVMETRREDETDYYDSLITLARDQKVRKLEELVEILGERKYEHSLFLASVVELIDNFNSMQHAQAKAIYDLFAYK
jgi:hypothetical protein